MSHLNPIRTVLILRFSALGDVAMTIPAIYSVARQHSDVTFYVATQPFFSRIFIETPSNVNIIAIDLKKHKGLKGMVRLIKELMTLHPDCVADLHNVLRTWIIDSAFSLRGIPVKMLDKQRKNRKKQTLHENKRPFVQRYFDVFNQLGLTCNEEFTSLDLSHINTHSSIDKAEERSIKIGFAPFARYLSKTYPYDYGKSLVKKLCQTPNVKVFVFGGKDDARKVDMWLTEIPEAINVIGKGSIEEELQLMSQLDLMVSMDSANMHLASLAGTRVISIWGGTTPSCGFMGWKQNDNDALCIGFSCQPCTTAGCDECMHGDFICMQSLTPDVVYNKIMSVIESPYK